jgi:hypothetical protein
MKLNSDEFVNDDFKIYVPESLIEEWKTTTNWITLSDRIDIKQN